MSDRVKTFAFVVIIAVCSMVGFIGLGGILGYQHAMAKCESSKADTVVVHHTDTVTLVESRYDTLVRIVEKFSPVAVHDTVTIGDTMYVVLPYEHRHWSQPDTVDVWYSGVDPSIDSCRVYVHTTTVTNTIEKNVYKMPRLTADLGAGALYHEKQVYPYLVGEMRYNARKTTWGAYSAIDNTGRWGAGLNVTYRINLIK